MPRVARLSVIVFLVLILGVAPIVLHRITYIHGKRFRVVTPDKVYRSGQMTAEGFREAVARYKIRTIINVQDDYPNPDIQCSVFTEETIKESELCRQLGVRMVFVAPNLISRRLVPEQRPQGIDHFLSVMDDPDTYPVLIHCKAGLHRTGVLVALYRMEYEGWSSYRAMQELLANGFGRSKATSANDYIKQYVLTYRPGQRHPFDPSPAAATRPAPEECCGSPKTD